MFFLWRIAGDIVNGIGDFFDSLGDDSSAGSGGGSGSGNGGGGSGGGGGNGQPTTGSRLPGPCSCWVSTTFGAGHETSNQLSTGASSGGVQGGVSTAPDGVRVNLTDPGTPNPLGSPITLNLGPTELPLGDGGQGVFLAAITGIITFGGGVALEAGLEGLAAEGAEAGTSFFEGTQYTSKVLQQMRGGVGEFHSFPESVTAFEGAGSASSITGGDGAAYQMLRIPGSYQSTGGTLYEGEFQFMKNSDGLINHRLFVPTR